MVDTTATLAASYDQSLSLQAQFSPSGDSLSLKEKSQATLVEQSANGDVFGAAVQVEISLTTQTGPGAAAVAAAAADPSAVAGQQALSKVEQSNAQARAFPKQVAGQKLQNAINELKILKLLGTGAEAAKAAAEIAKELGDAAATYAGAEQGQRQAGDIASIPAASTDPFYQSVNTALGQVQQFLQNTLPALDNSTDPKDREAARKARKDLGDATNQVQAAESGTGPGPLAADASASTPQAPAISAPIAIPTIAAPVDLVA